MKPVGRNGIASVKELKGYMLQSYEKILKTYESIGTLMGTAKAVGLSPYAVRRALVSIGIYPPGRTRDVHRMLLMGYSKEDICKALCISFESFQAHMPYTKGSYKLIKTKSKNAITIAEHRKRKAESNCITE